MNLVERDQKNIWHPFTQHKMADLPIPIVKAKGAYLYDEAGKSYLDMISSWWVNLHGHAHPKIAEAIYQQALQLEHVIFSGFTHEPAVALAEKILSILPTHFSKVFYSDNGSTAVELALKMVYQYWRNLGEPKRKRFLAFQGAYHGDTFGAMSVGKTTGFYQAFQDLLFEVKFFPFPSTYYADPHVIDNENRVLAEISDFLEISGEEVAGFIIEPLVQGVAGMQMCTPRFLQQLEVLLKAHGILVIYDEVMTGFGRTGEDFACVKAKTAPDILCCSKGITGGFLPLAASICHEKIFQAFLADEASKAMLHGHSYTANPLGCAAALASFEILQSSETRAQVRMIEVQHQNAMKIFSDSALLEKPRYCGTIAGFDIPGQDIYGSKRSLTLLKQFLERGLLIRPMGKFLYLLPPYCITEAELRQVYSIIIEEIEGVCV